MRFYQRKQDNNNKKSEKFFATLLLGQVADLEGPDLRKFCLDYICKAGATKNLWSLVEPYRFEALGRTKSQHQDSAQHPERCLLWTHFKCSKVQIKRLSSESTGPGCCLAWRHYTAPSWVAAGQGSLAPCLQKAKGSARSAQLEMPFLSLGRKVSK